MLPAWSYTRFSSKEQMMGTSQLRQDNGFTDFCRRHKLKPMEVNFHDKGKSGFRGTNLKHDLGKFLELIPNLPKPGVLVIEAFDRLSRQRPDKTIALLSKILESGINLGVIFIDQIVTIEDMGSWKFQMIAGAVNEAYQSSKQKSDRIKSYHTWKRESGTKKGKLPCWLRSDNGKIVVIQKKAAIIKQIFEKAQTMGTRKITAWLNQSGIEPIAAGYSAKSTLKWNIRFVESMLSNRQIIGEHRNRKFDADYNRVQVGEPIPDYFPVVVDEELFYAVQAARKDRERLKQRDAKETICLFTGLWKDARTKANMRLVNSSASEKKTGCNRRFASYHADGGQSSFESWKHEEFELAFLAFMNEITSETLKPKKTDNRLPALEGRRAELLKQAAELKKKLKGKDFTLLVELLEELQKEMDANAVAITQEKERLAQHENEASGDFKKIYELIQENPTDELKLQLRAVIRSLVSEIWIAIEKYGADAETGKRVRVLTCQIFMKDGRQKVFALYHIGRKVKVVGGETAKRPKLDLRQWDRKPLYPFLAKPM